MSDESTVTDAPRWERFSGDGSAFTIEHPSTWETVEGVASANVAFLEPPTVPGRFRANVNVVLGDRDPDAATLADQCLSNIGNLADVLTDAELLDAGPLSRGTTTGHRVLVTYREGREALTMEQWYWPAGEDRVLVVTATCPNDRYAENAMGFEHMAASVVPG